MGDEWPTVRLGNYVDSCLGKMLDKEKNRGDYYPYLGNKNVRWGNFDLEDLAHMRFEDHEHDRYGLKHGDLIVCEGGEPGRCAIWKNEVLNMKIQKALHRIRTGDGLNNVFLHYWFLWAGSTGALEPFFTGTTIKHLTGKALVDLQIPLPPIEEQKSIAHILGSLDDKIELNRQMNTTLEAMAQALFKSWFVDFDPVIDNALAVGNPIPEPFHLRAETRKALGDKRKPLPEAVQKQFSSRFLFSEEMGWIPEGWKVFTLADLCKKITDGAHQSPKSVDRDTGLPMASSKDLTHYGVDFSSCRYISKEDFSVLLNNGCAPDIGDVLVAKDGSRCGETCCIYSSNVPVVLLSSVAILRLKSLEYSTYINSLLSRPETIANLRENYVSGSAIPRIVLRDFKRYPVICPPEIIFKQWNINTESIHKRIVDSDCESNSLTSLRDALLPKLLSGQLRIPDAEKLMADAL